MNNLLTIVLTTFNRYNYLVSAVESILNQSYKDFDLVIVDNGSNDKTSEYLSKIKDKRLRLKRFEKNSLENVNFSFSFAKESKFFMIAHDDDLWDKNFLLEMIPIIESNSEINLVSSCVELIDFKGKNLNKNWPIVSENLIWDRHQYIDYYNFYGNILPCPATIFRAKILVDNNLNYEWSVGPAVDQFLLFKLNLLKGKFFLLKKPLLKYRIHQGQGSKKFNLDLQKKIINPTIELLKFNKTLCNKYIKASQVILFKVLFKNLISGDISPFLFIKELKKISPSIILNKYLHIHLYNSLILKSARIISRYN